MDQLSDNASLEGGTEHRKTTSGCHHLGRIGKHNPLYTQNRGSAKLGYFGKDRERAFFQVALDLCIEARRLNE
jgi:hypothetical protein